MFLLAARATPSGSRAAGCQSDAFPMTSATALGPAYIIAARRTALGRPGGLHKSRRIEGLTAPVVLAALEDAQLEASAVDEIIFGNTTAGGNPARIVGLAAGLGQRPRAHRGPPVRIRPRCHPARHARRCLGRSQGRHRRRRRIPVDGAVAGGRPKSLFQTPRFIGLEPEDGESADTPHSVTASEELARRLGISRHRQDNYTLHAHLKAEQAMSERRFLREIVPLRMAANETRDESADAQDIEALAGLEPIVPPDGTHTSGNISALQEGAAIAVIVVGGDARRARSPARPAVVGERHAGRRRQRGGARPGRGAREAAGTNSGFTRDQLALVEMSETSAAQALAVRDAFDLDEDELSPDGGALVRGYPLGAAGAVSVVRLFTRLMRRRAPQAALRRRHPGRHRRPRRGRAVRGGLGRPACTFRVKTTDAQRHMPSRSIFTRATGLSGIWHCRHPAWRQQLTMPLN